LTLTRYGTGLESNAYWTLSVCPPDVEKKNAVITCLW
jgi:hypothetical protein